MLGEPGRVIAGDRLERLVRVARIEVEEHPAHPIEQPTAALQGFDGIGEARRRGGAGDRGDFGALLVHAAVEGRREVLGANAVERRHAERRGPGLKERVLAHSTALADEPGNDQVQAKDEGDPDIEIEPLFIAEHLEKPDFCRR